jgi:protein TonB
MDKPKKICWEDICFEYGNKDYGAYILRYVYPYNLTVSAFIVIVIFLSIIVGPRLFKEKEAPVTVAKPVKVIDYTQLAPPPPIERIYVPPPKTEVVQKKVQKYEAPKVTTEEVKEEEEMPTIAEVKDNLDTTNIQGTGEGEVITTYTPPPPEPAEVAPPKPEPTVIVKPPQFPGGDKELVKWLGSHLRYPPMAEEMGIQGLVIVEFVVGMDGKLSDVTVVQSVHKLCDEEAIRLIKSMPDWIPGESTTGVAVATRKLPIRFALR